MHTDRKKRERCKQRCGHCQQLLSDMQYNYYNKFYYNSSLEQWKTVEDIKRSSVPDMRGSSSSESESKGMNQFIIKFTLLACQENSNAICSYVSLMKLPIIHAVMSLILG